MLNLEEHHMTDSLLKNNCASRGLLAYVAHGPKPDDPRDSDFLNPQTKTSVIVMPSASSQTS